MTPCQHSDCNKRAISFSAYCGLHTDPKTYVEALEGLEPGRYPEVFISEVELEGLRWRDLHFYESVIEDCSFSGGVWENIRMEYGQMKSCFLEEVMIRELKVDEESIMGACTFVDCNINGLQVITVGINNGEFRNCEIHKSLWDQSLLHQIDFLSCTFLGFEVAFCGLDTVSLQQCYLHDGKVHDIKSAVTFCLDTIFEKVAFGGELVHDFDRMQEPFELCLFTECTSTWDLRVEGFKTWNGLDEDPMGFYRRVLDHIIETVHVDNLSPVQFIVERMLDLSNDSTPLAHRIGDMFNVYFDHIRERQDLGGFGRLASLMSRLPQELILHKSQYLPAPAALKGENVLKIVLSTDVTDLKGLTNVMSRLHALETAIEKVGLGKIVLEDFRKGTVTIVISSTLAVVILILWLLYKAGHLFLNTQNMILTNQQLKREKKNAKANAEKLNQDIKLNEQQLILNDLEIEKRKRALRDQDLSDQYISVTREEVSEYIQEDPFDRLELKQLNELQKVADDVLELGETNVYVEILARAFDEE